MTQRAVKSVALVLVLGFFLALPGMSLSGNVATAGQPTNPQKLIKALDSSDPVEVAKTAYWLGQQGSAATVAVPRLAALLGDLRPVNAGRYRPRPDPALGSWPKTSPGEEAAVALTLIGGPAIESLISVLQHSPNAAARKNAAWALGIIAARTGH
jgi:HEAT repeat protein